MKRIVTFGEIMLRLAPPGYDRFVQAETFMAIYGGSEANVAISLACFGMDARFITKVPNHEIGQAAVNTLRRYGVDTSCIARGGNRLGVYFLEKGASQRASKVIYDRADSAIAEAEPGDFDWDEIFGGASWFHFSGITPAISDRAAGLCRDALIAAKRHGLTVSCDINYRKNLWSLEKAGRVMAEFMQYVDVCINPADVFKVDVGSMAMENDQPNPAAYESAAEQLTRRFGFSRVAFTLRSSKSANDNDVGGMLYAGGEAYFSKMHPIHIVDRVGGGDGFSAGLIYSMLQGKTDAEALEFAVAADCLKHTIEGDYNLTSADEVEKLACGDGLGRVQR